jgi:phytoene synthase
VSWTVEAAYERCERITAQEAKNFAFGIRLLPPDKRRAMSALYALARRVDDIGDGDAPVDEKLRGLAGVRDDVEALRAGSVDPADPVLVALADASRRYPIPLDGLDELVEGCEMDCRGAEYKTFEDLEVYCRCVAGSIGRLSLGIFGTERPAVAEPLADTLGIALQVTNILRDVLEDRSVMGRIYLPAEDLEAFGCEPDASGPPEAMGKLVVHEASRASEHYEEGLKLLPLLDRRSRACVGAMAGIYQRLLGRIVADPQAVLVRRVSLSNREKCIVAARSLMGFPA